MARKNLFELRDRLNALRTSAGMQPTRFVGTSRQAMQMLINKAERSEFPDAPAEADVGGPIHSPKPMNPTSRVFREHNPHVINVRTGRDRN